jgi:hypothetical protein
MAKKYTTHLWIGHCALRLMQLRPGMTMFQAVQAAAANHPYADHLEPQQAAAMLLEPQPQSEATAN